MFLYVLLIVLSALAWGLAFYFIILPKFRTFRETAAIASKIDAFNGSFFGSLELHLKGAKVAIVGLFASAAPLFGTTVASLGGMNWGAVFPTEKAATIAFVVAAVAVAAPLLMTLLHSFGMAEAIQIDPNAPAIPPVPVAPVVPATE
jgi:hypothetical protein